MGLIIIFLAGILLGLLTGFLPGIHPNLVASLLAQTTFLEDEKALLLVGMASVNLVASFILAIFFGIPDESVVVSILPGQKLTLAGRGLTALRISLVSMVLAAAVSLTLFEPAIWFYPQIYAMLSDYIKYIVLLLAVLMIVKSKKPLIAAVVFAAAGLLGFYSFHMMLPDPFLPLFSGMFALASLVNITKTKLPKQEKEEALERKIIPYIFLGVLFGFLADLLPGISSPAQIALFVGILIFLEPLEYLSLISAVGVSQAMFSFATAATIEKARIGTTVWLSKITDVSQQPFFFAVLFFFGLIVAATILYCLRKNISVMATLNSPLIAGVLIAYIAIVCFLIDGWVGLMIMVLGGILGWLTVQLNVERTQLMGAVVVPTLLLLFRIFL
ncbi:MAG: tripartite tricarboxylate transporter permease [Candidatus Bilamarchaeaceae archaeon]